MLFSEGVAHEFNVMVVTTVLYVSFSLKYWYECPLYQGIFSVLMMKLNNCVNKVMPTFPGISILFLVYHWGRELAYFLCCFILV